MKTLIFFATFTLTSMSWAGTIFEPSLSLGRGSGNTSGTIGTTSDSVDSSGTVAAFGFRYGITRRYIHVTGILEGTVLAGDEDPFFTGMMGLGIGYEWNIPLRTYLFAGAYDFDTDLMGAGAELAYQFSDSMWVGIRYSDFKAQVQQRFSNVDKVNVDIELKTVSLVVSFPIEFSYPDHWFRKTDWE